MEKMLQDQPTPEQIAKDRIATPLNLSKVVTLNELNTTEKNLKEAQEEVSRIEIMLKIANENLKIAENLAEKFREQSTKDTLTGLLDRNGWNESVKNIVAEFKRQPEGMKTKYALLALDMDHFKNVNDTFGHDVGDIVLKKAANILKDTFRETDVIARIGGEEFFIIVKDGEIDKILERLSAGRANGIPGIGFKVAGVIDPKTGETLEKTFSGGIVELVPTDIETVENAKKRADLCLYAGKNGGRNRIIQEEVSVISSAI